MELGRIITLVSGEKVAVVRVSLLTKIFVSGDVLSFLMQASGMLNFLLVLESELERKVG